jgi:hypothetical protein
VAREAADEVAHAGGAEGDDVVAGVVGGECVGGAAGVVRRLVHLQHVVLLGALLEHCVSFIVWKSIINHNRYRMNDDSAEEVLTDLVTGEEHFAGDPGHVVGLKVPGAAGFANVVGRRGRHAEHGRHEGHHDKSSGHGCCWKGRGRAEELPAGSKSL